MRRLIWLPIAGFLLIAGAAIAAAAAAPSLTSGQEAFDASSPAPAATASPGTDNGGPPAGTSGRPFGAGHAADLLNQVLSNLVSSGTITQAQSDAITNALQQEITDKQAQLQQQRQELQQEWTQIQGFLKDGVITQDEVNQLPADSPFRQAFNSIAQDGKVTTQQLMQLLQGFGFGPGRGFGGGPGMPGPGGPHGPGGPGWLWHYGGNGGNGSGPPASPSPGTTGSSS